MMLAVDTSIHVAYVGLVAAIATALIAGLVQIQLGRLRKENTEQHAHAQVARAAYGAQRERDHAEVIDAVDRTRRRVDRLEGMLTTHIAWEESEKYADLIKAHAELVRRVRDAAESDPNIADLLKPLED